MTHVDIPFLRYLDEEGRPVATLPTWLDKAVQGTLSSQRGDIRWRVRIERDAQ